jgi:hypothetical protein
MQAAQPLNLEVDQSFEDMLWTDVFDRPPTTAAASVAVGANQRHSRSPGCKSLRDRRGSRASKTPYVKSSRTAAGSSHVTRNMNACLMCSIQKQACDRGFPGMDGPKDGHSKLMPCSRKYPLKDCCTTSCTDWALHQDALGWVTSH